MVYLSFFIYLEGIQIPKNILGSDHSVLADVIHETGYLRQFDHLMQTGHMHSSKRYVSTDKWGSSGSGAAETADKEGNRQGTVFREASPAVPPWGVGIRIAVKPPVCLALNPVEYARLHSGGSAALVIKIFHEQMPLETPTLH